MNAVKIVSTFLLVLGIVIVAIFQMRIRGYEEVERINAWVLYYDAEIDNNEEELLYPHYIVKSGFEEKSLDDAIEEGLFNTEELELIYSLLLEED